MRILGLDVETTGLDVNSCEIIELGAVLWDTDRKAPLVTLSELVQLPPEQSVPDEITKITGITSSDLEEFGQPKKEVLTQLLKLVEQADYIMAHNAPFDRSFVEKSLNEFSDELDIKNSLEKTWLDTILDVPYPETIGSKKLNYLAAEHGFLNHYSHRAVFDVLTMLKIASHYDIEEIIALNSSPSLTVRAVVSFEEKDKAKAKGYRWDPKNRLWIKNLKEMHLDQERQSCDFDLTVL